MSIPAWDTRGAIPPINHLAPVDVVRSPYRVTLTEFIQHFGTSTDRRSILDGLLRFRQALHAAGLTRGFQWFDGSFLEHVELLEQRAPRDLDVVTFFEKPPGQTQAMLAAAAPQLFQRAYLKATYHMDAYFEDLGKAPGRLVDRSAYWYSVWSHRRDGTWKGYVQVDLAPTDDTAAAKALHQLQQMQEEEGAE